MNIPKYLWGDAILTASYLINRMPTKILQYTTPLECLKKVFSESRKNSELPLKIFGCTEYVHIPKRSRSKLEPRVEKCVFVGYTPNKKGYKCFNPLKKCFYTTMDVSFMENVPYFTKNLLQGEKLVEPNCWEIVEPLPSVILDISLEKENKETKPIESESEIGLSEEEILRMKKIETILSLWFIQGKKSLEEVKTSRSSQHMVNRKP